MLPPAWLKTPVPPSPTTIAPPSGSDTLPALRVKVPVTPGLLPRTMLPPFVPVRVPVCSQAASAVSPTTSDTWFWTKLPVNWSVPPLTVVAPVYVLALGRVRVPAPLLARLPPLLVSAVA